MSGRESIRRSLFPGAVLASVLLAGSAGAQSAPFPSTAEILKTARAEAEKMPAVPAHAADQLGANAPASRAAGVRKVLAELKALPAPQWNVYDRVRDSYYRAGDIDANIDLLLPRIVELIEGRDFPAARRLIEAIGGSATVYTPSTGIPGAPRVRYKPKVDAMLALAASYVG